MSIHRQAVFNMIKVFTLKRLLLAILWGERLALAIPRHIQSFADDNACPPFHGNMTLHEYQLYPENADWDSRQCLLYLDVLYNTTIVVYDPYKAQVVQKLILADVSYNPLIHLGGINYDRRTGLFAIAAAAGAPFMTRGQDISGPNYVYLYDPIRQTNLWTVDLNTLTGEKYAGFQDLEADPRGNIYVVGTWSSSIIRISSDGQDVKLWYLQLPVNHTRAGYSGLASVGEVLLVGDKNGYTGSKVVRFDMSKDAGNPFVIPMTPANFSLPTTDAVYLPPKYKGTVLLVAVQSNGTAVIVSKDDKWNAAEFKGYVPCASTGDAADSIVTATVQIAESIYTTQTWFDWPPNGSLAGNRSTFPMIDITKEVDALVNR